jgi:hypothetical protein
MAFVLFQGVSTARGRKPFDDVTDQDVATLKKFVTDSCYVWRKEGTALKNVDIDYERIKARRK